MQFDFYCSSYAKFYDDIIINYEYCALLFHKGSLLKDEPRILIQQTENVQSARQIRFTNIEEIEALRPVLKNFIYEAIEIEKLGLKVDFKKTSDYAIPEEFQKFLEKDSALNEAFEALTGKKGISYIFLKPNNQRQGKQELKKISRKYLRGKDGMSREAIYASPKYNVMHHFNTLRLYTHT